MALRAEPVGLELEAGLSPIRAGWVGRRRVYVLLRGLAFVVVRSSSPDRRRVLPVEGSSYVVSAVARRLRSVGWSSSASTGT